MNPVRHKLAPDQILFREGDAQTSFFLLLQGVISLFRTADGRQIELTRAAQNSVVGDVGYFTSGPRSFSARAVTDCELIEFRFDDISTAMKTLPPWAALMLRNLGEKTQQHQKLQKSIHEESTGLTLDDILRVSLIVRSSLMTLTPDQTGQVAWESVREYARQTFGIGALKLEPVVRRLADRGWLDLKTETPEASTARNASSLAALATLQASSSQLARMAKFEEFIRTYRASNHSQVLEMTETDELLLRGLVMAGSATDIHAHHNGSVAVGLEAALAQVHALAGSERLRADQFDLLVARGIDLKKESTDRGVMISFQLAENREVLENWTVLTALLRRKL